MMAMGFLLVACDGGQSQPTDPADINDRMQQPNGGFGKTDELPAFGDPQLDNSPVTPVAAMPSTSAWGPHPGATPRLGGFLDGKWVHVANGLGYMKGKWTDAEGKVVGHLWGLFGVDAAGQGMFYGKYIDLGGAFQALMSGEVWPGHFVGRWHAKNDQEGRLWGYHNGFGLPPAPAATAGGTGKPATQSVEEAPQPASANATACPPPAPFAVIPGHFIGVWELPPEVKSVSMCAFIGGTCTTEPSCEPGQVEIGHNLCQTRVRQSGQASPTVESADAVADNDLSAPATHICCVPDEDPTPSYTPHPRSARPSRQLVRR